MTSDLTIYDIESVEDAEWVPYDPGVSKVREFHAKFNCAISDVPGIPEVTDAGKVALDRYASALEAMGELLKKEAAAANEDGDEAAGLLLVRLQLIVEEGGELARAFVKRDVVGAFDALLDISYVTDGAYVVLGLGNLKAAGYEEVHRSNMSKLGEDGEPIISDAGRVVKGPNYSPPDLAKIVDAEIEKAS